MAETKLEDRSQILVKIITKKWSCHLVSCQSPLSYYNKLFYIYSLCPPEIWRHDHLKWKGKSLQVFSTWSKSSEQTEKQFSSIFFSFCFVLFLQQPSLPPCVLRHLLPSTLNSIWLITNKRKSGILSALKFTTSN